MSGRFKTTLQHNAFCRNLIAINDQEIIHENNETKS